MANSIGKKIYIKFLKKLGIGIYDDVTGAQIEYVPLIDSYSIPTHPTNYTLNICFSAIVMKDMVKK